MMDLEEEVVLLGAINVIYADMLNPPKRKKRRMWVRKWAQKRQQMMPLYEELKREDDYSFRNYLRMNSSSFDELCELVSPLIKKSDTRFRKSIPVASRLAVTLRYLATGDSYHSLWFLTGISEPSVSAIIPETCTAIYDVLVKQYVQIPSTKEEWKDVASNSFCKWNFPNCVGALDGKHVVIEAPPKCGSRYWNYKHTNSIVLMALVDGNYRFLYYSIGVNGRVSDGGIFNRSKLKSALEKDELHLPDPEALPGSNDLFPFFIVGDDAFSLSRYLMKPYSPGDMVLTKPQRIFNYRLSRFRRVVENAFGLLASVFRVYRAPIPLRPTIVKEVVKATICLHNFLISKNEKKYISPTIVDQENTTTHEDIEGDWRREGSGNGFHNFAQQGSNKPSTTAKDLRNQLCDYVNSETGAVYWQWDK